MILDQVKEILAEKLECEVEELEGDTKFSDLGLDSLDIAELLLSIEDQFGVAVEVNENLKSINDLVSSIEAAKK